MEQETLVDENFPLFSKPPKKIHKPLQSPRTHKTLHHPENSAHEIDIEIERTSNPNPNPSSAFAADETPSFSALGLPEWSVQTCRELGMKNPTPVQAHCIPKILAGRDVLGLAQTGSGKTAAFALPILKRLAENLYGVFALVVTPTRELAYQIAEQFRALGSGLRLRCAVVVGGMDMLTQKNALMGRPHVVIATPGRIKALLEEDTDIPPVFSRTKFLVLDEADRVLDVGFEAELRVVFQCLPKNRQTLLFSATMTSNLQTLLEVSANKAYFYEAYEGFRTVDTLKQQYVFKPKYLKEVYLAHILSRMEDMKIRSAIIFVSTCRTCHYLSLVLELLDKDVAALHSLKSQAERLGSLNKFKSGQASILIATDVASRGLDIPTVDLVINYDIPRYPRDYVHRVGRTARAGRGGLAVSFVTEVYNHFLEVALKSLGEGRFVCTLEFHFAPGIENDVDLVHQIEAHVGKELEEFKCKEGDINSEVGKIFKLRHVARMKMDDDGFEEKAKERREQKLKTLAEKGLSKKEGKKRKRGKSAN